MSIRSLIAVSLIASTVAAVAGPAGAPKGAAPARGMSADAVAGPNTKEVLSATYSASGNGLSASLPAFSFTTIASSTVKCNHLQGCSIGIESMAQMQTGGADWAICLLVDGATTSCQYQGVQSGPSSFVVGNARGWASGVSNGFHVVETQLYTESNSATYQYFQTEARIYKP
jgi:hypothetical protein